MFAATVQPPIVSLFSSTGSDPLNLFSLHCDTSLPADSFIHLLHDRSSQPPVPPPAVAILPPPITEGEGAVSERTGHSLHQTVLHVQSPTLRTTYIQCPRDAQINTLVPFGGHHKALEMKHPWMHMQVRNLGREWSFEVGLVDQSGRAGILRLSTFQKQPRLRLPKKLGSLPLLHLPLSFPSPTSHRLTAWATITLNLPSFIPYFSLPSLLASADDAAEDPNRLEGILRGNASLAPRGAYSHASYVRVYATCRLRRIWFSQGGPAQKIPWEFELYSTD